MPTTPLYLKARATFQKNDVFSATLRHGKRGAGGFTLLEMAVVIILVGFLSLLLVNQQTRVLQERASQARQDQMVDNATTILNAALDYHVDISQWPTGPRDSVAALATGVMRGYLPIPDLIRNPYASRPGLSEDFTLRGQPTELPTDRFMELSFQVWGESDARYIAGLLPSGTAMQVPGTEVWNVTTQVIEPGLETYLRRNGATTALGLNFEADPGEITQDRARPGGAGVQGIEDIDRITFDNNPVARTDANPNSILGADRVMHQVVETGDLTGLELEEREASLLLRDGAVTEHRVRFDLDAMGRGRLRLTQDIGGSLSTTEGVAIGLNEITVPNNGDITLGTGGDITIGSGGDVSVDGSDGLHERLCELEAELETASTGLTPSVTGTYAEDAACP